jgi:ribose-phosphate pyrophosphokinase
MSDTLNLVNPDDVLSCKYEISRFPDGQQSIRILEHNYETYLSLRDQKTPILIKSRLNTFQDLELIICANQALKEIGVKSVKLYIPYCIGGRSDRKFQEGGINYIKTVIAPIINSQNFDEVKILDPHSDVLEACINNFVKLTNFHLGVMSLKELGDGKRDIKDKICLVSPDAGAYKKIFDFASWFGIKEIITASKVRDLDSGKILKTVVPSLENYNDEMKYVIQDDICDGGRTFIELAKAIKEQKPDAKIYLVVTHGIFSAGFDLLVQYLDGIYCTNSIKDIQDGIIVDTFSRHKTIHSFVKQLNIF